MLKRKRFIYFLFLIIFSIPVFAFRSALTPPSMLEQQGIYGLLNGDNYWLGYNYFYNYTVVNYDVIDVNGTVNATEFCLGNVCILNWDFYDQSLNTTDNVVFNKVSANDWSNVTITTSQILDYSPAGINVAEYRGSDLSDSDGALNRTLTIDEPYQVIVDGFTLHYDIDYVYSGGDIIFLNRKWNEQYIQVEY